MTTVEVAERIGATYRQVDHWCRNSWLRVAAVGSGRSRQWSTQDVFVAWVLARLLEVNGTKFVKDVSRFLYEEEALAEGLLTIDWMGGDRKSVV